MKIVTALVVSQSICTVFAFAPNAGKAFVSKTKHVGQLKPLCMADPTEAELDSMSLDEEVDLLVQNEVSKTKRASNLRNEKGVEFAPWMKISASDEENIRQLMKEKAEARRKRQEEEASVSGNLYKDSQAQELSGGGLNYKIVDGGDAVELEWGTNSEKDTKGFIVKRRPAKTDEFVNLASYETFTPLMSKGTEGGIYRYFDDTIAPGGWVYRITEVDSNGTPSDMCQCLVEVQTPEEQRAAVFAAVGFVVFAAVAVGAGILFDPMNGY
mmetsp:Transcript_32908/g.50341  ORF Transcript_32908/g.50341 Transcript_32908/m.50341 type:complete len:269 (-) Transcript_32908:1349-2155(-)